MFPIFIQEHLLLKNISEVGISILIGKQKLSPNNLFLNMNFWATKVKRRSTIANVKIKIVPFFKVLSFKSLNDANMKPNAKISFIT